MLSDVSYYTYNTPHGPITIGVKGKAVYAVALGEQRFSGAFKPSNVSNKCANQLLEYFAGKRRAFDIPLDPQGSAFQRDIWRAMEAIPYGETRTNAEVAAAAGHAEAYRAVGSAVRKNPIVVMVPAHRVVGSNGKTSGVDLSAKRRLAFLEHERRVLDRS